jgi:hypothetical protein
MLLSGKRSNTEEGSLSLILSQSSVRAFRRCEQRWVYEYLDTLVPRKLAPELVLGTLIHTALQAHDTWRGIRSGTYMGDGLVTLRDVQDRDVHTLDVHEHVEDPWSTVLDLWEISVWQHMANAVLSEWPDIPGIARSVVERYLEIVRDRETTELVLLSEEAVRQGAWEGRIDLLYRNVETRQTILRDYKTTSRAFPTTDIRLRDPQLALYTRLLQGRYDIDRVEWQHLSTRLPIVALNKDGTLSKRQSWIDTPTARRHPDIDLARYTDDETFFQLRGSRVIPSVTSHIVSDMVKTARRMAEVAEDPTEAIRVQSWDCDRCPFSTLCTYELLGFETTIIRKERYRKRET